MDSKMAADFHCPICHDIYKDPVILACTHSFCKDCVKKCWQTMQSQECPVCRTVSKGQPVMNLTLKNLCELFLHQRNVPRCERHNKKLKVYCLTDKELICLMCRDSNHHANHKFHAVDEAALEHKEKLKRQLQPMQEKLKSFEEAKIICTRTATKIESQAQHTERQIRADFKRFHQFLHDEETARIAALKKEVKEKSQVVKEKIEKMNRQIATLSNTIRDIENRMQCDDVSFMQNYETTVSRASCQLQDPEQVTGPLVNVAKHLGNLKFMLWKKMQSLVEYAPVTLDPNTANPHLVISEDLTRIEYRQQPLPLPDNSERFDHYPCVLGSEGFNSGVHCWEVEVGDSPHWELGVMAESGQRKGTHQDENVTKCWTVRRSANEYLARPGIVPLLRFILNMPNIPLTPKQIPKRIRVQLDWDKGKVSFFDLDSKIYLHTFTYPFTEIVFPYFQTTSTLRVLTRRPVIAT